LVAKHAAMRGLGGRERALAVRAMGVEVLAMVRSAASRVIDHDFGEGISQEVDLERLSDSLLDFVRDMVRPGGGKTSASEAQSEVHHLLVALADYDATVEADMALVTAGSRAVVELMGPDSLAGVMAQLNVLVAGRDLLETELYVAEMVRLAEQAAALREDGSTVRLVRWARRRNREQRLPGPIRVSSYCLNNATTRILDRLHCGELRPTRVWLGRARSLFEMMRGRDSGFQLVRTTEALYLTVAAECGGDVAGVERFFRELGPAKALEVLEDLGRYENCRALVRAVEARAVAAVPELRHQLIRVP
jgi:hypothetical protein